jgi:hypothetical protein
VYRLKTLICWQRQEAVATKSNSFSSKTIITACLFLVFLSFFRVLF